MIEVMLCKIVRLSAAKHMNNALLRLKLVIVALGYKYKYKGYNSITLVVSTSVLVGTQRIQYRGT